MFYLELRQLETVLRGDDGLGAELWRNDDYRFIDTIATTCGADWKVHEFGGMKKAYLFRYSNGYIYITIMVRSA